MSAVDLGESCQTHIYNFLAKFGLDTAENEPRQVCPTEQCSSQVLRGHRIRGLPRRNPDDRHVAAADGRRRRRLGDEEGPDVGEAQDLNSFSYLIN